MPAASRETSVYVSIHGRRLGMAGDSSATGSTVLLLDGVPIGGTRSPIIKAVTGVSPAGPVTLAGTQTGDKVISVTDLSTPGDATAKFESIISVAGQIQQVTASTDTMLVVIQPAS
jgi:hypothetical protein